MGQTNRENRSYRGLLQSNDGLITRVLENGPDAIRFQTAFGLSPHMVRCLKMQPERYVKLSIWMGFWPDYKYETKISNVIT